MAMRDTKSTETKLQDEVLKLVMDHKKNIAVRYRGDAVQSLVNSGIDKKNKDPQVPPKYVKHFDTKEDRVGFSITKAASAFVENYANLHEIEYQQAYFEFICCGLENFNNKKPLG